MENKITTSPIASKISFKGHSLAVNEKGQKEYQFYLPAKKKDSLKAEVVLMNDNGEIVQNLSSKLVSKDGEVPVWTLPISSINNKNFTVAYRFNDNGRRIFDNTIKTSNKEFNEAIKMSRPVAEMPRQMYHLMPDSFNPQNDELLVSKSGKEIQRNHFNKFDGTISGVIDKLDEIKKFGAKRVISTPIFGDDTVSNHGYWTVNPYKITSTIGDKNDFKKLNIELLKNGLGWVADGAFANAGIESVFIQDIIRWGEKSPYLNWFDTKDFGLNGFKFGVLPPAGSEAAKHYDFKIMNSPLIYSFDKDGNKKENFGQENPYYDNNKPTYVQQFDRRLMNKNYINSPEMLNSYEKKQTEDASEITSYKDSVQLLRYNVDPNEVEEKIKSMQKMKIENKSSEHSPYRNMFTKWRNFSLETVDKDGTIRNWTGKKDIFALNYTNPEVQDFILGVPKFWTSETEKTLTSFIAKTLAYTKDNVELQKQEMQKITNAFDVNLSEQELDNILHGTYNVDLAPVKDSIKEELKDFPLVSSSAPKEIAALFSDSKVKNSAQLDKAFSKNIAPLVENIFKNSCPNAYKDDQLTNDGKQLFRLVSTDIMDYVSSYILSGESSAIDAEEGYNKISLPENFEEKVYRNLKYQSSTRDEAIEKLFTAFSSGSKKLNSDTRAQSDIKNIIENTLKNVDFTSVKKAKALSSILETGLEWRIDASKDTMDLDQITQGKADAKITWNIVQNLWKDFVHNVREYNPKAYIIGEVTDMYNYFGNDADKMEKDFIKETGFTTQTNYSHIFNIMNRIVHGAPEVPYGGPYHVSLSNSNSKEYTLSSALKNFFDSGYADNIRYSHEGVGNHDKPRALHGYAVNIADFFNLNMQKPEKVMASAEFKSAASVIRTSKEYVKGKSDKEILDIIKDGEWLFTDGEIRKALIEKDPSRKLFVDYKNNLESVRKQLANKEEVNAVRDALIDALDKAEKRLSLGKEKRDAIATALNDFATGRISDDSLEQKKIQEQFKVRPFNYTIENAVKRANLKFNEEITGKIVSTIHEEMMKPAFSKYKSMLEILVALPGNPTIYAGDEFGETGFETPGNNVHVQNRNQIHRNWVEDSDRGEFARFNTALKETFNLRNMKEFSPFVNGDTIVLENFAGDNVAGVYRYNKNRDIIAVFNTNGFDNNRDANKVTEKPILSIPISANFDISEAFGSNQFIRINSDGTSVNDGYYKMQNNTLKKYDDEACTKLSTGIALTGAATYFVRLVKNSVEKQIPSVSTALKAKFLSGANQISKCF